MSNRQDIKKGASRGKSLRDTRKEREAAAHEKRVKQHNMLRRGPLVEVQEEPSSVKSKSDKQKERLRAWQKARDERKRQEKLKKKEPFRCGTTRPFYLDPVDKPAVSNARQSKQTKPGSDVASSGPVTRSRSGKLPSQIGTASKTTSIKSQSSTSPHAKQPSRKETASTKKQQVSSVPTDLPKPSSPTLALSKMPCTIQDPAWIPGATITTQSVPVPDKTFDEVFGNSKGSSPFLFGRSAQPTNFTFSKMLNSPANIVKEMTADINSAVSDDSLNDEEHEQVSYKQLFNDSMDESSNNQGKEKKDKTTNEHGSDKKERKKKIDTEHPVTDVEAEKKADENGSTDVCKVDFPYFRALYSDVEKEFQLSCKIWNEKLENLDNVPSEQVIDQIRTTVCQAQLLVRSKMKQYLGLVEKAEDATATRKTTAEDLQGFWDMVYYQVTDIREKFNELVKLEQNNWQQPMQPSSPVHPQPRRSKRKAAVSKPAAAPSEKLIAARQKRDADRKRLREQMAAMKKSKPTTPKRSDQDEEDTVYSTPPSSPPRSSILSSHRRSSTRVSRRHKV